LRAPRALSPRRARGLVLALIGLSSGCGGERPSFERSIVVTVPSAERAGPAAARAVESAPATARSAPPPPEPHVAGPCEAGSIVDEHQVRDAVSGHFTAADADEVFGSIACDPSLIDLGAEVLFRRVNGGLETVRVKPNIDSRAGWVDWRTFRLPSGRDLLVGRFDAVTYGEIDQALVAVDFSKGEEDDETVLVRAIDTTDTACTGATDLLIGGIDAVGRADVNRDGLDDLRVTVRELSVRVPPQPPCVSMGSLGAGQIPPNLPKAPPNVLELLLGPSGFTPSNASKHKALAIAKLVADAPR
jgi:hypothetical protein